MINSARILINSARIMGCAVGAMSAAVRAAVRGAARSVQQRSAAAAVSVLGKQRFGRAVRVVNSCDQL